MGETKIMTISSEGYNPDRDEAENKVSEIKEGTGLEGKKEKGPESFQWVDVTLPGDIAVREMEFPSGKRYQLDEYTDDLYYHLHDNKPLPDIPTTRDLIYLVGSSLHSYQDIDFLELAYRQSPEEFSKIVDRFEQSLRIRAIIDAVADFFALDKLDNEIALGCDGVDKYWFDRLDTEKLREEKKASSGLRIVDPKFSPAIRDAVTRIYLRFSPPVGSLESVYFDQKWEVNDYLSNEDLREEFADEIPNIGRDLMAVREQVKDDPISAIKSVFSHLPAYNAGKMGAYIGNAVLKFRDRLDKEELIGFVENNNTIGEFDKRPLITAIERAFAAKDDSARIKGDMRY
jgi:hypothetical protein